LNYKAKVLQLEKEKLNLSQGQTEVPNMVVVVPSVAEARPSTEGLVQAMSQVSLKVGEIKGLKGDIEKLKQEMKTKDERMDQLQKENKSLQERVDKLKTRLRGKGLLQGAKHIIWDSIVVEATKFRVYLNFINEKYSMAFTSRSRGTVVNETLAKKPSEWAQNSINLLNFIPTAEIQTNGVKDRTTLII
jgi:FtsZ-binding cell division protein ZapB